MGTNYIRDIEDLGEVEEGAPPSSRKTECSFCGNTEKRTFLIHNSVGDAALCLSCLHTIYDTMFDRMVLYDFDIRKRKGH